MTAHGDAAPASPRASQGGTAASPARFGVLAVYCAASFLCAAAWNTLAPIYSIAQQRFDVGPSAITLVALSMFLTYVPGSVLALFVTARHGLRADLLLGAALQTAMCGLKWAGVALCATPHGAYALLLAGQLLGGLGQPLILNVVARLTMDWFPPSERDTATLVGYQASNAGAMLFNALPAWVVRHPGDLAGLMLAQLLPWLLLLSVFPYALRTDTPPVPPSAAAAVQWAARRAAAAALPPETSPGAAAVAALRRDLSTLARHRNFMLLAAVFSLVAGMAWALPTVEGQLIEPCGYSARVAGGAGAALLGAGVLACAAAAPLLTPQRGGYLALQRQLVAAAAAATLLVLAANRPGNAPALLASWAALGAAQGPLGPVTLEHAAEITFPMSADSSSAALFIVSNLWSFLQVSALAPLLARPASAHCTTVATPAAALVACCMAAGTGLAWALREEGRRAAAECGGDADVAVVGEAAGGEGAEAADVPLLTHAQHRAAASASATLDAL